MWHRYAVLRKSPLITAKRRPRGKRKARRPPSLRDSTLLKGGAAILGRGLLPGDRRHLEGGGPGEGGGRRHLEEGDPG